jgi:hypothetical protein
MLGEPINRFDCLIGMNQGQGKDYEFQRALAAFFAIHFRLRGASALALALPPFNPPRRPALTAEGTFSGLGVGSTGRPSLSASR